MTLESRRRALALVIVLFSTTVLLPLVTSPPTYPGDAGAGNPDNGIGTGVPVDDQATEPSIDPVDESNPGPTVDPGDPIAILPADPGTTHPDPFEAGRPVPAADLPPSEHSFSYQDAPDEGYRTLRGASGRSPEDLQEHRLAVNPQATAALGLPSPPPLASGDAGRPLSPLFLPSAFVDADALRIADPGMTQGNNLDDTGPDWAHGEKPKSFGPGVLQDKPTPYKGKPYEKLAYHLCPAGAPADFRNFRWDAYDPVIRDQGGWDDALGTFVFAPDGESDTVSYFGDPLFPGADNPDGLVFFFHWRDQDCDGIPNLFEVRWPFGEFWGDRTNAKVTYAFEFPYEDAFLNKDGDLVRDESRFAQHIGTWEDGEPLFYPPGMAPATDGRPESFNVQNAFEEVYDDVDHDGVLTAGGKDSYARYWDVRLELDGPLGENNGIIEGAFYDVYTTDFQRSGVVEDWRVMLFLDHDDNGKGPLDNVMASQHQVDEHYWLDNFGAIYFHSPPEAFTDAYTRAPNFGKLPFHLGDKMNGGPKVKDFSGVPPPPVSPIASPPVALSLGGLGCGGGVDRGYPAKYAEGVYQGLYLLLQEILDAGLTVPPQLVPYWIYTRSDGGVEKFCQAITNVPVTLNVDNNAATGKGLLGDLRVVSHLELGPLAAVSKVDLLGDVNPVFLHYNVSFPAFFFNGEAHDLDGEPWWKFGYETQPAEPIPRDVTMTLAVDHTVGAEHVFDFDWDSIAGIPHLGFHFGIFQVVGQDLSDPRFPSTGEFTVTSPPFAFLTFTTTSTGLSTTNCMVWSAPFAFGLSYGFSGNQTLFGTSVLYQIDVTVQNVPTSFSLCLTQDRGAATDTIAYTASADVALVQWDMALNITGITNLSVVLEIHDLTTGFSATLGDGTLHFVVTPDGDTIGSLLLQITEMTGFLDLLHAFASQTIVFYSLEVDDLPSFDASWSTRTASPPWNFFKVQTASLPIGSIELAMSSEPGAFLFFGSAEVQKAQLYHNDSFDLGGGFVMEASLWVHYEDLTRAEVVWGGASPTVAVGLSTAVPHALRALVQLANNSVLNRIDPPGPLSDTNLTASLRTTLLPASMDFNITTATNFTYTASAEIDLLTADLRTDEARVHVEVAGIPGTADGQWDVDENGFVVVHLSDRIERVEGIVERADRLFATEFRHVEFRVLDIPEGFNAAWDTPNKTARLSFIDGSYDEGLGEISFLATTGAGANATAYMNSLGVDSTCMVDYSPYTQAIDGDYWPASVPGRLDALYCRHPTLDTVADDYAVQRKGANATDNFNLTAFKVREIGLFAINWTATDGFAHLEFSRNVALDRAFIYIADDFGTDAITVAEASHLPDGEANNFIHAEWDFVLLPGERNRINYTLTEVVPFIDYYSGVHNRANLSASMRKAVLQDLPEEVSLEWLFGNRTGSADFNASSPWELGVLEQTGGKRYAGWVAMQSMHFDYDFALPGEETCNFPGSFNIAEFCYRVFRLDATLDAVGTVLDGMLGIYSLNTGLETLDSSEVPDGNEFIPDFAFMMDDFDILEVHVLWDVGAAVNGLLFLAGGIPIPEFMLAPTVTITLNVGTIVADFFWNDKVDESLVSGVPLPFFFVPNPCPTSIWTVDIKINTVKDYVDQNPVHLFPLAGASFLDDHTTGSYSPPDLVFPCLPPEFITLHISFDIPGFHRAVDHPTLFP